ncbi:helix-turn-helix transcriptional regulator [Mixta mediterraneensis]|uniref:helix-turn-helix transcriptional regulator n=1 Tax=Mixta mediterraneensis TaxID=2758443 RepID=UPI001EEE8870|nr:AlpA family transcriptional regulator [Mixta mediterraneensis]
MSEKHGADMTTSKKLVRLSEVLNRTGYSRAWIYKLIAQGRFPQPVKIGSRSIAFVENEIDEWINQRIAESRREVA